MAREADDNLAMLRAFADAVISEAIQRDPNHVVQVILQVLDRFQAEGRYSAQELEAAVEVLLDDLSALTHGRPFS